MCRFRKITWFCWVQFSSAFPGLIIWHLHDQLFQCSSTSLAGTNTVEVRMLYLLYFFFFSKLLLLNKFLPGRNPKQALPASILTLPPCAGSSALPFCNFLVPFWSTALSFFFQGLQGHQRERGTKNMLKTLKERTRREKCKDMSRCGKKRQNKHS